MGYLNVTFRSTLFESRYFTWNKSCCIRDDQKKFMLILSRTWAFEKKFHGKHLLEYLIWGYISRALEFVWLICVGGGNPLEHHRFYSHFNPQSLYLPWSSKVDYRKVWSKHPITTPPLKAVLYSIQSDDISLQSHSGKMFLYPGTFQSSQDPRSKRETPHTAVHITIWVSPYQALHSALQFAVWPHICLLEHQIFQNIDVSMLYRPNIYMAFFPGFKQWLSVFALDLMAQFQPDFWNPETCNSIWLDVIYCSLIGSLTEWATLHRWD